MFRQTPTVLYLCGAPGIGKSHLVLKIVKSINENLYKFDDFNKIVFARTVTTEHWDGYHNQPIVVFDDHYKMIDGEQEVDAREVMNVVSCTNYFPSFAVLHQKGTPFNSNFLIITSNTGWPLTVYINAALQRRHKLHIIIVPNSKNKDLNFKHLNFYYAKCPVDVWEGNYCYPFSCLHDVPYDLIEWDKFPYKHLYKQITFDQLINLCINDYLCEKEIFNNLK